MSSTTAIVFFTIFLAAMAHFVTPISICPLFHAAQNDSGTFKSSKYLRTAEMDNMTLICKHIGFHKFIINNLSPNTALEQVMNDTINSLCHLWVSLEVMAINA